MEIGHAFFQLPTHLQARAVHLATITILKAAANGSSLHPILNIVRHTKVFVWGDLIQLEKQMSTRREPVHVRNAPFIICALKLLLGTGKPPWPWSRIVFKNVGIPLVIVVFPNCALERGLHIELTTLRERAVECLMAHRGARLTLMRTILCIGGMAATAALFISPKL